MTVIYAIIFAASALMLFAHIQGYRKRRDSRNAVYIIMYLILTAYTFAATLMRL